MIGPVFANVGVADFTGSGQYAEESLVRNNGYTVDGKL
jgi:hypothetical protein